MSNHTTEISGNEEVSISRPFSCSVADDPKRIGPSETKDAIRCGSWC
jgi:hypothetical protein